MKLITKLSLLVLFSLSCMKAQVIQKWLQIGTGFPKNLTSMPAMTFDKNGHLFLVYTDQSNSMNKPTLKKFDGQTWNTLSSQFTQGQAMFLKIDLDSAGMPYVAFQEPHPVTKKITVMKFNGTAWDTVGARGFATADFNNPELTFCINRTNNMPCIAFRENSSGKASVMLFTGTNWTYNGGAGLTQSDATKLSLSCQGAVCFLAFRNGAKGDKLSVIGDNGGGGWTYQGDTVLSVGIPDYINCRRYLGSTSNFVGLAYKDANDNKAYLKIRYGNSNTWQQAGNVPLSDGIAHHITLAQKREQIQNDHLYCGFTDALVSGNATVTKFIASNPAATYTVVGKKGFTTRLVYLRAPFMLLLESINKIACTLSGNRSVNTWFLNTGTSIPI
jgi:hypothetical protein